MPEILTKKFDDDSVYKGEWRDGKMHGEGTLTFSEGAIYEGNFVDGALDGVGKLLLPNDTTILGVFKKNVFIPDTRKVAKPDRKIIIIENSLSITGDISPAIANSYGINEDQIKRVDEETEIPSIEECVCERGDDLGSQVLVAIHDHGDVDGNFGSQDFIKTKLTELFFAIKDYNQLEINEKKVKRVKLNLLTCYGDACITNSLLGIIKTFTDAGIEVRTSAIKGDAQSSAIIGNGKNYAEGYGNETVIIERLFTSSKSEARKFKSEKREKYHNIEIRKVTSKETPLLTFCASGEKHYKDLTSFLKDEYDEPSAKLKAAAAGLVHSSIDAKRPRNA